MAVTSYQTIARDGEAEIEVERSRFRCTLVRVGDEAEARAVVEQVRRRHWEARHHCSAFVVGPERAVEAAHDDGEPSGTAGPPILGILRGRELGDVVAVVSRWFGGTLLGTGGLTRAYAEATRVALDEVGTVERVLQDLCEVMVDIAAVGRLEHDLRSRGARVLGVDYTGEATLRFAVPPAARGVIEEIVAELTAGTAVPRTIGQQWVDAR
ncbi:uncharacterized protein, YigZ family [Nocardioides scoriae]|uniref:Uncharacterized protein, YigZ family n=1 Tax=Nocardioides scoriae TaxID=642780 RepID=A0A1H1STT4_9ACTN|nr:YigZ family protein [Nocardioides scoriae]SDS51392.1 uncharacterized protein, YigZ family [Nocardioides scoriae]